METTDNKYSEQDLAEVLCTLLFDEDIISKKNNDSLRIIINNYIEDNYQVPYDRITEYMFNLKSNDDVNKIAQSANERIDTIKNLVNDDDFTNKLKRHINLSRIQKSAILDASEQAHITAIKSQKIAQKAVDNAEESQKIAQKAVKNANEFKEIAQGAVNNAKHFKNIKEKIYTDFISILGIFTAISFTMFGGLQLLGNVFGSFKNYDIHSLGFILILGSVFLFSMYSLLIVLFNGITKLSIANETNKYIINRTILVILIFTCLFCIILGTIFIII